MSNYNDLVLPEDEKLQQCPYHKTHMILKHRFAKHLEKCRRSYAGTDMQKCRFNISHHIPAPEIQHHELTCSDRLFVEKFLQGAAKRKAEPKDDQNNSKKAKLVDTDDEWDDSNAQQPPAKPIDRRKYVEESTDFIVHHQHATKSQRKADREERYQRIRLKEEKDEANSKRQKLE